MKLGFAKFLMIVALGATVSAWGGAALSSVESRSDHPVKIQVEILESAMVCEAYPLT